MKFMDNNNNRLTLGDIALLKLGRHFRVDGSTVVVGRNKEENQRLLSIARRERKPYLEVIDYMSPITLLEGENNEKIIEKAAEITVRYSDAPIDVEVYVKYVAKDTHTMRAHAAKKEDIESFRT